MVSEWIFPKYWQVMVNTLGSALHQCSTFRMAVVFAAMLFPEAEKPSQAGFVPQA